MKKKILLILILCLTTAGCSLYPDGSISGSDEKNVEVKEDNDTKHIQTIINSSVSVDIDVEDYKATALKELKAEYRNWSEQEMKDVVDLFSINRNMEGYSDNNPERRGYTYDDESKLSIGTGCISFYTPKSLERNYQYYNQEIISGKKSKEEVFPKEELDDFPKQQAVQEVRDLCNRLNINLSSNEPIVYTYDKDSMTKVMMRNEEILRYNKTKSGEILNEISWGYEDELYYMEFDVELYGLEMMKYSINDNSKYSVDTKVTVAFGRNGIEQFDAYMLFDEKEIVNDNLQIVDIEDIVKQLSAFLMYNNQLDEQTITDIKLIYVPMGIKGSKDAQKQVTIRPFWSCTVTRSLYSEKDGISSKDCERNMIIIDAQNKDTYRTGNIGFE
jgi:hypothetical protein